VDQYSINDHQGMGLPAFDLFGIGINNNYPGAITNGKKGYEYEELNINESVH
jgi:hypothetical protein